MNEIAQIISNYGFSVVLLAWLIIKDYKFNEQVLSCLEKINVVLAKLETWHNADGGGDDVHS